MEIKPYQEPHWRLTTFMEALYLSGIYHPKKALMQEQIKYVLDENQLNASILLSALMQDKFLVERGRMYYLSELGTHHAKKRIATFEKVLSEHEKKGTHGNYQIRSILNTRYEFIERIESILKPTKGMIPKTKKGSRIPPNRLEFEKLEKRVTELENKMEKLKSL